MSQMIAMESRTVSDRVEELMRELPGLPATVEDRKEAMRRLHQAIEWLRGQNRLQKEKEGCTGCADRGRQMKIRRRRAKTCNNCEFRKGNVCSVDGGDKRIYIVDGGCPKDKFKE